MSTHTLLYFTDKLIKLKHLKRSHKTWKLNYYQRERERERERELLLTTWFQPYVSLTEHIIYPSPFT